MQPSAAQPPTHAVNIEPEDRASVGEGEEEGPRAWCSWSRVHFLLVGARYTVFGGLFALMGVILAATAPGMILWHNSLSSWCYFAAAMVGLLIAARMVNWLVFKPLEKLVHSWAWQLYFYFSSFDGVLTVVLWAAASLAVFERYMSDTTDDVEFVLVRLLWSAIIVSICTGFRRLLVKMLAISATRRDFESQVAELTFHQHALQCMCDREAMVPANVPRHVRWLSQLRNKKFKLQVEPGEKRRAITSGKSARSAAKRIFQRIDWHNRGFLTIDNFLEYLSHEDAARVFTFYDVNEDEQVALQEFTLGVESLFLRWASISTNLRNRESLSRALDFIISIVFWFLMLMVVLLVLNVDLSQFLVLFSSMIISFSFAFGATAQRLVLSLLFVFVYKCYDVGDRVRIADSRRTLVVTKVGVFVTQFRAITNEVIYFPNHQLAEMHIENLRRSTNATINVNIHIAYRTTAAQVAELERRLKLYVRGLPDVWRRDASVYIGDVQQHTGIMLLDIWVRAHARRTRTPHARACAPCRCGAGGSHPRHAGVAPHQLAARHDHRLGPHAPGAVPAAPAGGPEDRFHHAPAARRAVRRPALPARPRALSSAQPQAHRPPRSRRGRQQPQRRRG